MNELMSFKFNQIGIIHNLALDAISNLADFPNNSNEESYYMGIKVQDEIFKNLCNEIDYPDYSDIKPYYDLIKGEDAYLKVITELLKNGIISKILADEMKFHYNNLIAVDNYKELTQAVSDFIKHFKSNKKLTPEEIIICWGTASVTLFSYNYWKNVEFNPESPWYKLYHKNKNSTKAKSKFWKIVGVIAADCAGILIGGAAGSVFGPGGAVAGAGAAGAGASKAAQG